MSTRTVWRVTLSFVDLRDVEVCADSADEAKEIAEDLYKSERAAALHAEWVDPETPKDNGNG